ncbi:VOC family protein [Rhizobium johnstonii]|uniref:VOC family protein n=1 Tax=Rhizobium johnstonii TaxID=3019933 RepID=UPI003F96D4FD
MNEHSAKPRPLDHVVLPVVNIDLARERLGKLGFTVAADARHPFGTENACVFFAGKTYLEPLGIASVEESEASARQGNVFTARNQAFRFRCGEEGLSGLAFGSKDAGIDHQNFVGNGSSAGEIDCRLQAGLRRRPARAGSPAFRCRARQSATGRTRRAGDACQWRDRHNGDRALRA